MNERIGGLVNLGSSFQGSCLFAQIPSVPFVLSWLGLGHSGNEYSHSFTSKLNFIYSILIYLLSHITAGDYILPNSLGMDFSGKGSSLLTDAILIHRGF